MIHLVGHWQLIDIKTFLIYNDKQIALITQLPETIQNIDINHKERVDRLTFE